MEIKQSTNPPIAAEVIAESIVKIGNAMQAINGTRLTREAIITLIHHRSKVARRDIELVMTNLTQLEQIWLKPAPKKP